MILSSRSARWWRRRAAAARRSPRARGDVAGRDSEPDLLPSTTTSPSVILLIGLAVGVDYSLFYLRREREERAAGRSADATRSSAAAATSGRAVLISGLTVIVAMAGMFISGDKTFISFAEGTILVVAIAMFASLTVLPALLAWLGDRVDKGRVPFLGRRRGPAGESRFWSASSTARHAAARLSRSSWPGALLVALAIPALSMNVVTRRGRPAAGPRRHQDLQPHQGCLPDRGRRPRRSSSRRTTCAPARRRPASRAQRARRSTSDYVRPGPEVTYSKDGTVAQIDVPTPGNGNDAESTPRSNEIRDEIIPATIGRVDGVDASTSAAMPRLEGLPRPAQQPAAADLRLRLRPHVPAAAGHVPLDRDPDQGDPAQPALGRRGLRRAGAGVPERPRRESLLGFKSNGGVTNWLPLFLFVILFGLSMDYHVFILSRVRERYDRGGMSTTEAVRHGISTTAGTVTSAAFVMVVVFSVFATLSFLDFKEMGVGLAVAVLIDATIIRGVLLPASMKVLGDWNWYLPSWLEWLPQRGQSDREAAGPVVAPPVLGPTG